MDKKTLVNIDIEEGKKLIDLLDRSGMKISSAFWLYLTEIQEWRLMLATPDIDTLGRKKTYAKILELLNQHLESIDMPLDAISVISPDQELNRHLRTVVKKGKEISGRFSGIVVNGTLIEDTYLYRVN
jgi:hypothetical protein